MQNDYNWWSTISESEDGEGGNYRFGYVFQHGGSDDLRSSSAGEVNTLTFNEFNGRIQDGSEHRFLGTPNYTGTSSNNWSGFGDFGNSRCPIYIDVNDNSGYVL